MSLLRKAHLILFSPLIHKIFHLSFVWVCIVQNILVHRDAAQCVYKETRDLAVGGG